MPVFDPTQKFGTVGGNSVKFPNAKYEQSGYLFDSLHRCLNPPELQKKKIPFPPTDRENKHFKKLKKRLEDCTLRLKKADEEWLISGDTLKKAALTRARNMYEKSVLELDEFKKKGTLDDAKDIS